MLGGAVGAAAGKLSSSVFMNALIGFAGGGALSVLVHGMVQGVMYVVVRWVFQAELGERTIGGYQGDSLSAFFGAITGMCGAVVVTLVLPSDSLREPYAFTLCWSTATLVAIMLSLVLWWRAQRI